MIFFESIVDPDNDKSSSLLRLFRGPGFRYVVLLVACMCFFQFSSLPFRRLDLQALSSKGETKWAALDNETVTTKGDFVGRNPGLQESPQENISAADTHNMSEATQRWSSKQVLTWLLEESEDGSNTTRKNWSDVDFFLSNLPPPEEEDIEIYNLAAWRKLQSILLGFGTSSGRSAPAIRKVVVNGGSVTARAGHIEPQYRWDNQWIDMLQSKRTPQIDRSEHPSIEATNRAHGARDTGHSAILMHTFIPKDVDVLVWEFAINDGVLGDCTMINNMIIKYLDQLQWQYPAYNNRDPPLVILVYVWSQSFATVKDKTNKTGNGRKILDQVFACHDRFPAKYEFVVGTVNLATYVSHRFHDWTLKEWHKLHVDHVHPSNFGHAVLAFLLWDLVVNGDQRRMISPGHKTNETEPQEESSPKKKVQLASSSCANHGADTAIARVQTLLTEQFSLASWSGETPQNSAHAPGMIYPSVLVLSKFKNSSTTFNGLSDPMTYQSAWEGNDNIRNRIVSISSRPGMDMRWKSPWSFSLHAERWVGLGGNHDAADSLFERLARLSGWTHPH